MQKGQKNQKNSPVKKRKKMALGKGLGALIPNTKSLPPQARKEYIYCNINQIHPNRYQPRRKFAQDELAELSQSIQEQGIIQPLVVRQNIDGYELVAGERRLRAAKMAGLTQVPVIIRNLSDAKLLEMSIVENIQREDLNPMEESQAYYQLMTEFNLTQELVAGRVGKSRSAIANYLRLRQLPEQIRETISNNTLSLGHAKVLLGADTPAHQMEAWQQVISKKMSVKETEQLVNRLKGEKKDPLVSEPGSDDIYFLDIAEKLSRHYGTKVQIKRRGNKGRVEIEFYNNEDLNRLIELLNAE